MVQKTPSFSQGRGNYYPQYYLDLRFSTLPFWRHQYPRHVIRTLRHRLLKKIFHHVTPLPADSDGFNNPRSL